MCQLSEGMSGQATRLHHQMPYRIAPYPAQCNARANEHDDKSLFVGSAGHQHGTSFIEGTLPYPSNTILALQNRRLT